MVEMHLPPEHVFILSSAPFHPFPTPFCSNEDYQLAVLVSPDYPSRWMPSVGTDAGAELLPVWHTTFVSSPGFRPCSYSGKIFDDEIAKRNFREHNTNISVPGCLRGLCSNSSVDWSTATAAIPDPSLPSGFPLRAPEASLKAWRGQKHLHCSTLNAMAYFSIH